LRIFKEIPIEPLNRAAGIICLQKDFAALSKRHGSNKTTICNVYFAKWTESKNGLVFTVSANRFLWGMVRAMVGLMIALGNGKISESEFIQALTSENRRPIANSASPKGLFLKAVEYPENSLTLLANPKYNIL
jgi:tRNA pseudouridine38-40 synthase